MRQGNTYTTQELTVILGISGHLQGLSMYGLSVMTALKLGGILKGQELLQLDDTLLEAMGELGNRIAAQAAELLERAGVECELATPRLMQGVGTEVPTVAPTLLVPVNTDVGKLSIEVSLRRLQAA